MAAPRRHRPIATALVVYKKSAWDLHSGADIADPATRRAMLRAHKDNQRAFDEVMRVLDRYRIVHHATARAELAKPDVGEDAPDVVISIGGDGTFLAASHQVAGGLILGVNSSPQHSVGFFCSATLESFQPLFAKAMEGRLDVVKLHRLEVTVNRERLPHLALNDVLITHKNPGATSRYALKIGAIEELQRSSGLWIATAAGSTAGIRAAGGRILPLGSDRIQYAVRELYVPPGEKAPRLTSGLVPGDGTARVVCRMVDGALFIDGPRNPVDLAIGDRVVVKRSSRPLHVLGLDPRRGRHRGGR